MACMHCQCPFSVQCPGPLPNPFGKAGGVQFLAVPRHLFDSSVPNPSHISQVRGADLKLYLFLLAMARSAELRRSRRLRMSRGRNRHLRKTKLSLRRYLEQITGSGRTMCNPHETAPARPTAR